jgi:hypothetical protein
MAPVTWITCFILPVLVTACNKNESITIPIHTAAQVVKSIYHQLHSKFVILLHESTKYDGRKYLDIRYSIIIVEAGVAQAV